jgi:DNA-binding transcriptional ArsR family regulator
LSAYRSAVANPTGSTFVGDRRRAGGLLAPGRTALLRALQQPRSAASLARELGIQRQKLNYHLRVLERAGLVECVEERRKGNCLERIMRATARAYVLDGEIQFRSAEERDACCRELSGIVAALHDRYGEAAPAGSSYRLLVALHPTSPLDGALDGREMDDQRSTGPSSRTGSRTRSGPSTESR